MLGIVGSTRSLSLRGGGESDEVFGRLGRMVATVFTMIVVPVFDAIFYGVASPDRSVVG
jgi:hypothetical protein